MCTARDAVSVSRFATRFAHLKFALQVPTRRDDLEAMALMLIHLLTHAGLSWTRNGVPKETPEHDRLKKEKARARPEDLCRGMPSEFEEFLRYCRKLRFAELPDYERWREEFRGLMAEHGFGEDEKFLWPPPAVDVSSIKNISCGQMLSMASQLRKAPQPTPRRPAPLQEDGIEKILNDLATLKLVPEGRPVLGDRPVVVNAVNQAKEDARKTKQASADSKKKKAVASHNSLLSDPPTGVIIISDSDTTSGDSLPAPKDKIPEGTRLPKAVQLRKVVDDLGHAGDNLALSHVVGDFVRVLRDSHSRNLTKEGFAVLDTLVKQLADPNAFAVPLRRNKSKGNALENENESDAVQRPRYAKATKLVSLRRDVRVATSNTELATMVQDFGKVTDASNGRTITKDGYAFLDGLVARLREIG